MYPRFCDLFGYVPYVLHQGSNMAVEEKRPRISDWEELRLAGARLTHYSQGHTVFSTRTLIMDLKLNQGSDLITLIDRYSGQNE